MTGKVWETMVRPGQTRSTTALCMDCALNDIESSIDPLSVTEAQGRCDTCL